MNSVVILEKVYGFLYLGVVEYYYDEEVNSMFGFIVFLFLESVIFLSFFVGYIIYKIIMFDWLLFGIFGLEVREFVINIVILVFSSFVIYFVEKVLEKDNLIWFCIFLVIIMVMGIYFVVG